MPEETYFVAVDGRQLDGEHEMGQVRQICTQYAGRQVMVWNEGLGSWTDPKTLPTFRVAASVPAPAPAPAPTPAPAPVPAPAPRAVHPAAAGAAAAGAAAGSVMAEDASALKGLLDFKFETLVAPKLIRVLYVVLVVLCGLGVLGGLYSGLRTVITGIRFDSFGMAVTGFVMMLVTPLIAAFYVALMRVILEGVFVVFQLKEKLEKKA